MKCGDPRGPFSTMHSTGGGGNLRKLCCCGGGSPYNGDRGLTALPQKLVRPPSWERSSEKSLEGHALPTPLIDKVYYLSGVVKNYEVGAKPSACSPRYLGR